MHNNDSSITNNPYFCSMKTKEEIRSYSRLFDGFFALLFDNSVFHVDLSDGGDGKKKKGEQKKMFASLCHKILFFVCRFNMRDRRTPFRIV